ncbi:hypothetical protein BDZ91DRAFT_715230 [Kalaharituber pfeilii]|nr:hypothetical protein BDZ91DRAFT_715230 [Kalaharituber pfeilii]
MEVTEYMLFYYNKTPMQTPILQGNAYLREIYFSAKLHHASEVLHMPLQTLRCFVSG